MGFERGVGEKNRAFKGGGGVKRKIVGLNGDHQKNLQILQ